MDDLLAARIKSLSLDARSVDRIFKGYKDPGQGRGEGVENEYDAELEEEEEQEVEDDYDSEKEEEEEYRRSCKVVVRNIPNQFTIYKLHTFLEGHVGWGSVASCDPFFHDGGTNGRALSYVHFHDYQSAMQAIHLGKQGRLRFDNVKIGVFPSESAANRRKRQERSRCKSFKECKVYMGCLMSESVFCHLSSLENCCITVDKRSKRFRIIALPERISMRTHKLEWRFEQIHEMRWCRASNAADPSFMMRTWAAPQIFRLCAGSIYDSSEVWSCTVDFTDQASIGQSFAYFLDIPQRFRKKFENHMQKLFTSPEKKEVLMWRGGSYGSISQKIAPALSEDRLAKLPFEIVFVVNSLVQHGYLPGPNLPESFLELLRPSSGASVRKICYLLEQLKRRAETCFYPTEWFSHELRNFCRQSAQVREKLTKQGFDDDGLVMVRKVFVTPTRMYFYGPEIDVSNRVTRHFRAWIDDFIRVKFVDEDFDMLPSSALATPGKKQPSSAGSAGQYGEIYDRIIDVLNNGIVIGKKTFEFLAFSTSQLRENSVWMFASNSLVSADGIRRWMGDFLRIRNVAKCAARMGQSFSSSTKSVDVERWETEEIPEIRNEGCPYPFSDGIGKISESFAVRVAKKCRLVKQYGVPSSYQIRYGGYKGVVAVDPTMESSSYKLSLRPSMNKFPSEQISLDILNWSRPMPSYLNREIITLLSTLGIADSVFEGMQARVLVKLEAMMEDAELAMEVLETFAGGQQQQVLLKMLSCGFRADREPFLRSMLHAFRACQLSQLRRKAHIFVPKGGLLMGCLDETRTLDYGQVFICVSPSRAPLLHHRSSFDDGLETRVVCRGIGGSTRAVKIVRGKVIVAKNPCCHPGDVRILSAVDVPSLRHLVDCVVFPQRGPRPHPSECSGSDLDGDLYFVSWDKNLIPVAMDEPQDYQPGDESSLLRPVTTQDIVKYFGEFMVNNSLGMLCNAHVVHADTQPAKARSPECMELARLCSIAVDFPKTGIPAVLPQSLRPLAYPDFMEKPDKQAYKSNGVIGKFYKAVGADEELAEASMASFFTSGCYYDEDLEFPGFRSHLDEAQWNKHVYDDRLLNLMHFYGIRSEAEIFGGSILRLARPYQRRPGDATERIARAMASLRKDSKLWLKGDDDAGSEEDGEVDLWSKEELARASAAYHVTYHESFLPPAHGQQQQQQQHLISFPWIAYDELGYIKTLALIRRNRAH